MTRFLLDTDVVSALRVRGRNPGVEEWASRIPVADMFVSSLTIAEIELGIEAKGRTDPDQAAVLRAWFEDRLLPAFAGRVAAFDLRAARVLATYRVPDHSPLDDAVVAATAQACGMTIATRNVRHFAPLGVAVINPWEWANPVAEPRE